MAAKVDLHLHSPAGGDYRGDPGTSPAQICDRCRQEGLDLVVLADHMTLEAWPPFELESKRRAELVVLPGVELKLRLGELPVHLVAVFDPSCAEARFEKVLSLLAPFIVRGHHFSTAEIAAEPAFVLRCLSDANALVIAAHLDRLEGGREALEKLQEAGGVDAVEFDRIELAAEYSPNGLAAVSSSDAHSLDEIGRRFTEVVMEEISFGGLAATLRAGKKRVVANAG